MNYLLKNGRVIDPHQGIDEVRDVFIKNGKVYLQNVASISQADITSIDCAGKIIVPGLIDVHTHMRDPGFEHKEDIISGTKAALAGGVTTLFCMANTNPVVDTVEIVQYIIKKALEEGFVSVCPIAAMTEGMRGKKTLDFDSLRQAGAITFSDDGRWVHDSRIMLKIFRLAARLGVRVIQHSEDIAMTLKGVIHAGKSAKALKVRGIPSVSEYAAIYRDCVLCELTKSKLHVAHVSARGSLAVIEDAKRRGVDVTCEVTPHHLVMDDSFITSDDGIYKVNPPLRSKKDRKALIEALKRGSIDVIATDHAPHAVHEKEKGLVDAPFGMIGMETSFSILYTHLVLTNTITLFDLIALMSSNPARVFELHGKGTLQDESIADITVIDINHEYTIDKNSLYSKSSNTPFHGWKVNGKIEDVFVGGIHKLRSGEIIDNKTGVA